MMDIKTLAKKSDPFASFALIIAAITLIFAGTTAIIGNNVRDSIIDCNTKFGQNLVDSLTPRSEAQTELDVAQKKLDEATRVFLAADNKTDEVTLLVLDKLKNSDDLKLAIKAKSTAFKEVAARQAEVLKKRAKITENRTDNPYPKPPTKTGCNE